MSLAAPVTTPLSPIRVAKPNTRRARYLRMKYSDGQQAAAAAPQVEAAALPAEHPMHSPMGYAYDFADYNSSVRFEAATKKRGTFLKRIFSTVFTNRDEKGMAKALGGQQIDTANLRRVNQGQPVKPVMSGAPVAASTNQPARPASVAALQATRAAGVPDGQTPVIQRVANWLTGRGENDAVVPDEAKKIVGFHKAAAAMHDQAGGPQHAAAAAAHTKAAQAWDSAPAVGASLAASQPKAGLTRRQRYEQSLGMSAGSPPVAAALKPLAAQDILSALGPSKMATVMQVKAKLQGKVPQGQKQFVQAIESAGFDLQWSPKNNAYMVVPRGVKIYSVTPGGSNEKIIGLSAPAIPAAHLPEGGGIPIDVWNRGQPKPKVAAASAVLAYRFDDVVGNTKFARDVSAMRLTVKTAGPISRVQPRSSDQIPQIAKIAAKYGGKPEQQIDASAPVSTSGMTRRQRYEQSQVAASITVAAALDDDKKPDAAKMTASAIKAGANFAGAAADKIREAKGFLYKSHDAVGNDGAARSFYLGVINHMDAALAALKSRNIS